MRIINIRTLKSLKLNKLGLLNFHRFHAEIKNDTKFCSISCSDKTANTVLDSHPQPVSNRQLKLVYERFNKNDVSLIRFLSGTHSKKENKKFGRIIIEGSCLIGEALDSGLYMHCLLFNKIDLLRSLENKIIEAQKSMNSKVYKLSNHDIKIWSTLKTPTGILACFDKPKQSVPLVPTMPITVICDNIKEPSNLGSIVRTSAAIGCREILLTKGCCNPWHPKAIRTGCGGHFHIHILENMDWNHITLHMHNITKDISVFIAESNIPRGKFYGDLIEYTDIKETSRHNAIVIGNEGCGISEDAYRFLDVVESRSHCVHVPLSSGADSLNVASAFTLIAYELRKVLVKKTEPL